MEKMACLSARDVHYLAITSVDWKKIASEYVFKADLPGLRMEPEVLVQVEDPDARTLTISGKRKRKEVHKTNTCNRVELTFGCYFRKLTPIWTGVTAEMDSGVLTVVVPKAEKKEKKPEARRIEIRGEAAPALEESKVNDAAAPAESPQQ